ncbi:MAG: type II toxin-antitoxin system Phd/YefM family antitoxin [Firmicutes bacterium]|nr:type II toxin-antitoxin system Phd/YefM family antitoxin [Bacillota bacterium]
MIINSTEMQNNFGKYLMLAANEDIIITRNGAPVAKLVGLQRDYDVPTDTDTMSVKEEAPSIRTYPHFVKRASYEQFLELTKGLEARYEYIDGAIYLQASPKTPHQVAVTELLVQFYMSTEGTECRPFVAPYDITLKRSDKDVNVVQPDLMIICDLDEHLADDGYYKGVPRLVVEILSDGTARFDLIKKFDLYMSCGVSEYWVVDPEEQIVFIYGFENGKLIQQSTYKATGKAKSMVFPDLAVDLARVFR